MGFQITQVGLHDSSAGVVQVQHIEGRWAFGVFGERPMVWCSDNGKPIYGWDEAITGVHVEPKPAPFRISDNGCGIYETRDGREAVVRILNDTTHEGRPIRGRIRGNDFDFCWGDDGLNQPSKFDCGSDLVLFIGPIPKPADNRPDPGEGWRLLEDETDVMTDGDECQGHGSTWGRVTESWFGFTLKDMRERCPSYQYRRRVPAETWTPTARFQDRVLNRDAGGPIPDGAFWSYRGGESKLVVREQCWVCGDREEWRVPEVCVCGDTEVSRG